MENFRRGVVGRLLLAEVDPNTRFKYTIWFDYTRKLVNELHEGDLVAVPNFASDSNGTRYSILQLVTVMPMHYALGTDIKDLKGYPGFVMQAAKSASADWTEQEEESYEDTTKIVCEAIPTNLEYDENDNKEPIQPESAMAMVGKDVSILTSEMTEKIFNRGINKDDKNVIIIGDLIRDRNVKIYVRVEDLVKIHFGIFGFTGVGKSNLVSTLVSELLSTDETIKIILFDLMDEYTGLLVDQLLTNNGKIICLGDKTLRKPVFDYVNESSTNLDFAAKIFLDDLLLPKGLRKEKANFKPFITEILKNRKIKIFEEAFTVKDFLNEVWPEVEGRFREPKKGMLNDLKKDVFGKNLNDELTPELAQEFINKLGFGEFRSQPIASVTKVLKEPDLKERIQYTLIERLKQIEESSRIQLSKNAKIVMQEIIKDLNDESKSSLYIITSHNPDEVKSFAENLGEDLFESRRLGGLISPLVLFIFDEADQFIPLTPRSDSEKLSKLVIETLTRRGRKFGIGVGIATQRSAYLDTNIMGQLHTYFISKLPRKHDREVVGEAFSLSPEQFTQTFKFQKGQWLLVSHEATGIDMPIPIQAPNAEDRIKEFLKKPSV